jgi:hypothetical protein
MPQIIGGTVMYLRFVILFLATVTVANAQAAALKGLPGVYVHVSVTQNPDFDLSQLGARLQTKAELHLRQSGIRIQSGRTVLNVMVSYCIRKGTGDVALFVQSELSEDATLTRNGAPVRASSYPASSLISLTTLNRIDAEIEASVLDAVDHFANDFLTANPLPDPVRQKAAPVVRH